nr:uncharacterized protein LOC129453467 [Misgurnus anguillicaudatus]
MLNHQTGDLNISDIRWEHSGVYKLKITRDGKTSYKTISVSVRCETKILKVDEGESVDLKINVKDIQRVEKIEWRFGETLIAEINPAKNIFSTYDGDDDLFRDKLTLNDQTGDLNINDIREKHSGDYKLKIIRDGETSDRRFIVFVRGIEREDSKENTVNVSEENTGNVSEKNTVNVSDENTVNVSDENKGKDSDENTVNISDENTVNVSDENTVNVSDENTVNVSDENKGKDSDENTVNISDENTVNVSDENTVNVSDENKGKDSDENTVNVSDENKGKDSQTTGEDSEKTTGEDSEKTKGKD